MKIVEIKIEGIRGIPAGEHGISLDFNSAAKELPRWIVVAGRNGAGKSTFMKSVALAVSGPSVARQLAESFSGWVRDGEDKATASVRMTFSDSDGFAAGRKPMFDPWTSLRWKREDGPEPILERNAMGGRWTPERGPWAQNLSGWFLVGYGPFRRLSPAPTEALRLMMSPGRPTALASLFREDASLSESVQWLQSIYLRRLEGSGEAAELERLVLALLDDGLLPEGVRVEKIDSVGLWIKTPEGQVISLAELSDGYRTVAGLVLDIVKQIHAMNGSVHASVEGTPMVMQDGVVLVDEIDVHLHVEWQKRIGFWMKEHFPEMQFIVSTHSPFICHAADEGGLVRLSPPWQDGPAAEIVDSETFNRVVNGTTDEAFLTDLFGLERTISDRALKDRERLSKLEMEILIEGEDSEKMKEMNDISKRIPASQVAVVDSVVRRRS